MNAGDKEQLQKAFGKVIKNLRLESNISQVELAERGGFNRTYVSDLERGIKQASLSTIVRLSNALEIKPNELMKRLDSIFEKRSTS